MEKERDQLSIDVADRAKSLNKLLEDNKRLKNQLSQATKEFGEIYTRAHKMKIATEGNELLNMMKLQMEQLAAPTHS